MGYKLTEEERGLLAEKVYGGDAKAFARDLPQIETAAGAAVYYYYRGEEEVFIERDKAIRILGAEKWLSGIARAAFRWNASRDAADGRTIYIDCSSIFK